MNNKIIKLMSLALLGSAIASTLHYLLSIINGDSLKALAYGSIFILATMGVVLDSNFSEYFNLKNGSILAILSTIVTFIFITGAFRAFTLNQPIEGLILSLGIALFWVTLLAIYIKLLITPKPEEKQQWL